MANNYYPHDLDDDNIKDLQNWIDNNQLEGLVEETSGGIIGYLNKDHCDRIAGKLNSVKDLIKLLEWIESISNIDDDGDTFFCKEADFSKLIKQAIELAKKE